MRVLFSLMLTAAAMTATTIEKLSLDEMTAKSTAIVRGKVSFSHVAQHGAVYYTHYKVSVYERLKGSAAAQVDVVMPGGRIGKSEQTFSGIPTFEANSEVVLFLWTSKAGMTHVIGLGQGIFNVSKDVAGQTILSRGAIREGMVDAKTGRPVEDAWVRMTMTELQGRIRDGAVTK